VIKRFMNLYRNFYWYRAMVWAHDFIINIWVQTWSLKPFFTKK